MDAKGTAYREHLENAVRNGRKPQSVLDGPALPREVAYLWEWFGELECTRSANEVGLMPITYSEILAWSKLMDRNVRPHEVEALLMLDVTMRCKPDDNG